MQFAVYFIATLLAIISSACGLNREELITAAIQDVKLSELTASVQNDRASNKLLRAFKRATDEAVQQGNARLRFEKMVRKAEQNILEVQAVEQAAEGEIAEAESLAAIIEHQTGTVLTREEVARISQESGCERRVPTPPDCSLPANRDHRTVTGACNNIQNPLFGAANTQFRRLIPSQYEDGFNQLRGTMQSRTSNKYFFPDGQFQAPNPSARTISTAIVRDKKIFDQEHTHIIMQWGQFLDHDVNLAPEFSQECHGCEENEVCVPIPINREDSVFGAAGETCHEYKRSLPACDSATNQGILSPREQINEITSFIDGSMVYGSLDEVFNAVREHRDGLLRTGPSIPAGGKPSLPIDTSTEPRLVACPREGAKCFLAGDLRVNEQPGLIIMHTIWVREHNRIARALKAGNPNANDEQLFQTARAIVAAEIQKITYKDYLPTVLGDAIDLLGDYSRYNPDVNPNIPNGFAGAAYRFGHSQIRPDFDRLDRDYEPLSIGPLNLQDVFFDPNTYTSSLGTDPILRGFLDRQARVTDEFLNSVLTNHLFQLEAGASHGLDLAALNIQRGRDHGLPPYLTWRRWAEKECNLAERFDRRKTRSRLLQTYGSLETVDLFVGGLAEENVQGGIVGPTFACIFATTFQALRDGDRFYYENPDGVLNAKQRAEIEKTSLSRIICDNSDDIPRIQRNAFLFDKNRVQCGALPEVDLSAWEGGATTVPGNGCYLKATFLNPSSSREVTVTTTVGQQEVGSVTVPFRDRNACVPFTCPTAAQSEVQVTLTASQRRNAPHCSLFPNFGPISQRTFAQDALTIPVTQSSLTSTGFYTSLDACKQERSSVDIFEGDFIAKVKCPTYEAEAESSDEELEALEQRTKVVEILEHLLEEKVKEQLG